MHFLLVAEKIEDGSTINAGRDDRITIDRAAELIFEITEWRPKKIKHDSCKPEGVASQAADLTKARKILGWEPKISYREGFKKSIDWYFATHKPEEVARGLNRRLMER